MPDFGTLELALTLPLVFLSFAVSAAAGLGGSLILVPTTCLFLGTKEGIAIAALLLGLNNVAKVVVYRHTLPVRKALLVVVLVALGAGAGAGLMTRAPERWVSAAVVASILASFLLERLDRQRVRRAFGSWFALGSGLTSGFSGTSGPLKGIALRGLGLDRLSFVGSASLVSLAGDATKAAVFANAAYFQNGVGWYVLACLPLIPVATMLGRHVNRRIGEHAYAGLFWTVMTGYTVRLLAS